MFQDILKESWVYQEIGQEFLEQGFEKGLEAERQRRVQGLRQILIGIVVTHFPEITKQAQQHIDPIHDPEVLQAIILKLLAARKLEEAKGIFPDVAS